MRSSSDSDESVDNSQTDITEIEAWYTPEVPVRHGPSEYWGLPGLILELSAGQTTMLCTKVVINPIEKIEIEDCKGEGMIFLETEAKAGFGWSPRTIHDASDRNQGSD